MELRRRGDDWTATRTQPIRSEGAYSVCPLAALDVVLIVGTRPTSVWLYDVPTGRSWELPPPVDDLMWAAAVGDKTFAVVGRNAVVTYSMRRAAGGLEVDVGVGLSTDLGELSACAVLPGESRLAAGNGTGDLFLVDTQALPPSRGHLRLR